MVARRGTIGMFRSLDRMRKGVRGKERGKIEKKKKKRKIKYRKLIGNILKLKFDVKNY